MAGRHGYPQKFQPKLPELIAKDPVEHQLSTPPWCSTPTHDA